MFFGGDPFANMHGSHGGGRRSARSRDVDTNKLYETLGVSRRVASALCSNDARVLLFLTLVFLYSLYAFTILGKQKCRRQGH